MWARLKAHLLQHLRLRESWVLFFVLGLIMMNFPFIHMFNKPRTIFGFPLLYLYLMLGWLVSICVIFLFTCAQGASDTDGDQDEHEEGPR